MILYPLPNKKPQANDYLHTAHTTANRRQHMTDEQARAATGPALTDLQRDRRDFARRDYDEARAEDLARLPRAHLILLVERMRGRLGDMIDLVNEICDDTHPS